ncbi:MAG: hypothetical protein ACKOB4_19435, partial [Acidobacteriota bacterium]
NLDIDSYDLYVIESMLDGGFHPTIITMEINEKIPPGIFFTVEFDEHHVWKEDHFFGCSLDAACEIVTRYGYTLSRVEYNNAFFIRSDKMMENLSVVEAYNNGYRNRVDRQQLFYYNSNVDYWLELSPEEALEEIRQFFGRYEGLFTIRRSLSTTRARE